MTNVEIHIHKCWNNETRKFEDVHCEKFKWISVKERSPEKDGRYLVVEDHDYNWIGVCSLRKGKFDIEVTHWMPLPSFPEQAK